MNFFQKHKNRIFALCLVAILLSCFMGFSVFSSASELSVITPLDTFTWYLRHDSDYYAFSESNGVYSVYSPQFSVDGLTVAPYFNNVYFESYVSLSVVPPEGKTSYLSFDFSFTVLYDGSIAAADGVLDSILSAVAWRSCSAYFSDSSGNNITLQPVSFVLRDASTGQIVDPDDDSYWSVFASSAYNVSFSALFDLSSYPGSLINYTYVSFPYPSSGYSLWASSGGLVYELSDVSASYTLLYKPFSDVVQDDLSDIKGSLSGVSNKLDSISSSMNTIDQDINRVNQTVSDLRDDLTQGDPDIESSNSDLQDQITDVKDEIGVIDSEINSVVSDILDKYPDAENPFDAPDVPILSDIWASEFIEELWGFFKAQSIFFTFIHTGLLFCLVSFILRR